MAKEEFKYTPEKPVGKLSVDYIRRSLRQEQAAGNPQCLFTKGGDFISYEAAFKHLDTLQANDVHTISISF